MKIVFSQRVDHIEDRQEYRDAIDQRLPNWIQELQALPVPIPNGLGKEVELWLDVIKPDGVLLSGGNNIGNFSLRDKTESALLDYARKKNCPVLGICRGMQFLATEDGAALRPISGHAGTSHSLRLNQFEGPLISSHVSSFHDYALQSAPPNYHVLATAPDGSIEAIRHVSLRWEGWMWHPERDIRFATQDLARARYLFGNSNEY